MPTSPVTPVRWDCQAASYAKESPPGKRQPARRRRRSAFQPPDCPRWAPESRSTPRSHWLYRTKLGETEGKAALTFKLGHDDLTVYNYVQRLLYAGIIVVGVLIVLSGLSMWKPVQLYYLVALFGDYPTARYVHFFCMAAICAFLVIHVALALLVPKSLRAMIIGR